MIRQRDIRFSFGEFWAVNFALPPVETTADLPKASGALLEAVASGELTPSEAAELGKLVEARVKAEVTDIATRLDALERAQTRTR